MNQLKTLDDVYTLLKELDSADSAPARINIMCSYLERVAGIAAVRVVLKEQLEPGSCPDTACVISSERLVLRDNTRTPVVTFGEKNANSPTLFLPLTGTCGTFFGAILLKGDNPRQILKRHRSLFGIMSSKASDLLRQDAMDRQLKKGAAGSPAQHDPFTPEALGRLLDLLHLPMYVTASDGHFVSVNGNFLSRFAFSNLSELNENKDFFTHADSWSEDLTRLTAAEPTDGFEVHVITGKGQTRAVRDHSTLVGRDTFGILVDVNDYIHINDDLRQALEEQKLLVERLSATTSVLRKTQATAMRSLAKLAEYRDKETGNHLKRICNYMHIIADRVQEYQPYDFYVSRGYVNDIYISGMLHDIGKVAIPDTILLKPGPLSTDEWDVMRRHPEMGWSILHQADKELGEQSFLTLASRIALYHHEKYNGTGYPAGLSGNTIPLSARIASIADVYDALTSNRPYKSAWKHEDAIEEIRSQRGKHFDPVLVDLLLDSHGSFVEVKNMEIDDQTVVN